MSVAIAMSTLVMAVIILRGNDHDKQKTPKPEKLISDKDVNKRVTTLICHFLTKTASSGTSTNWYEIP